MMELLSPAGNYDCLLSALNSGADAVYLGLTSFSARAGAQNFLPEDLEKIGALCAAHNVKIYLTLNTMMFGREMEQIETMLPYIARAGVHGVIVQDLGLARYLHKVLPDLPLHGSTQMAIHTRSGAELLQQMGFRRVVLARELSLEQIREISQNVEIETEVFVHGALCMSYSGHCYLSSVIGQKSGNRGRCAQPCRLPWQNGRPLLSLKDLSLLDHLDELQAAGVHTLKIEGRLKSAQYVSLVTHCFAAALRGQAIAPEMRKSLADIFSRQGFTDGYLTARYGAEMFGVKLPTSHADYQAAISLNASLKDVKRFPLRVSAQLYTTNSCVWSFSDGETTIQLNTPAAQQAKTSPSDRQSVARQMAKLGDTPYALDTCEVQNTQGAFLSAAEGNEIRRKGIAALDAARIARRPQYSLKKLSQNGQKYCESPKKPPSLQVLFYDCKNMPSQTILDTVDRVWLPAHALPKTLPKNCGIWLDPFITQQALEQSLSVANKRGVSHLLIGNLGQIMPAIQAGFHVTGDTGLNIANSAALSQLHEFGIGAQFVSFELSLAQIRHLTGPMPMGIIAYGRLPLMRYKNCVIQQFQNCTQHSGFVPLQDRTNAKFLLQCRPQCGNLLLNSQPLMLQDRLEDLQNTPLSMLRLDFTDESAEQVAQIISAYQKGGSVDGAHTRGLYYRGVL